MELKKKVLFGILIGILVIGGIFFMINRNQTQIFEIENPKLNIFTKQSSFNPSDTREIGYEFINSTTGNVTNYANADVIHSWNNLSDYFFNKSSGIQFTNVYNEYWSKNIFCAGYKDGSGDWIYNCNDALPFTWNVNTDNLTYVNFTGWKDITIGAKTVRAAIRYHLKTLDQNLTIQLSLENVGESDINSDLGFAWKTTDININNDNNGDYIFVNDTSFLLNETVNKNYSNMDLAYYKLFGGGDMWLKWDEGLNYVLRVKSETGQTNAPVTLGINAGTLTVGQEKRTTMYWQDARNLQSVALTSPVNNTNYDQLDTFTYTCELTYSGGGPSGTVGDGNWSYCSGLGCTPDTLLTSGTSDLTGDDANGLFTQCTGSACSGYTASQTITANTGGTYNLRCGAFDQNPNHFFSEIYTITVNNVPPVWVNNLTVEQEIMAGDTLNYTATGTADIAQYRLEVCSTDGITTGSCDDVQLCASGNTNSGSPVTCQYGTTSANAGNLTGYGFICDTDNLCAISAQNSTFVDVNYGNLNVEIQDPTSPLDVNQTDIFWINATVKCIGTAEADCGQITATARYNLTGSPDTIINSTEGETPLYVFDEGLLGDYQNGTQYIDTGVDMGGDVEGVGFNGSQFAAFSADRSIYFYNTDGSYTGTSVSTTGQCDSANVYGVEYYGNKVYVICTNGGAEKVYRYTTSGYDSFTFLIEAQDGIPRGIAFDGTSFFVTGQLNNKLHKYNSAGTFQGVPINFTGVLSSPFGVAENDSHFLITASNKDSIWIFDQPTGTLTQEITTNSSDSSYQDITMNFTSDFFYVTNVDVGNEGIDIIQREVIKENPQTNNSLTLDETWNVTFQVNVSSTGPNQYLNDVFFNSTYGNTNVTDNSTDDVVINIGDGAGEPEPPADTSNVTLISPANNSVDQPTSIYFIANSTSPDELTNFTLYTDISGSWVANQTKFTELPDNQLDDTYNNINMTGNVLLLHMNNDSSVGESDAVVRDFSGNGLNFTTIGNDAAPIQGKISGGWGFDGTDDYIRRADNAAYSGLDAITISFWVNISDFGGGSHYQHLVSKNNYASDREYRVRMEQGGWLVWHISSDGNDPGTAEARVNLAGNFTVNRWYHIVVTYDDNNNDVLNVYLNGSFVANATGMAGGIWDGSSNLAFGSSGDGGGGGADDLNGQMDEIAIWNRALNQSEVTRLYNVTKDYHVNFTVGGIPEGTYVWNVETTDNNDVSEFAVGNFTFSVAAAGDTCTYTTGDWVVNCADNCVVEANTDLGGNVLSLYGIGTFNVRATLSNMDRILKINSCRVDTDAPNLFQVNV